jgi:hypothetical protein
MLIFYVADVYFKCFFEIMLILNVVKPEFMLRLQWKILTYSRYDGYRTVFSATIFFECYSVDLMTTLF